jgi:uncharacterized membrane protein
MDPILLDWLSLFVRWVHVMLGIGWIGTSFFFVWLDMSLRANPNAPKGVGGESWMVHGGGFYHAQKYLVAPQALPKELHWFKYEAYYTWVSGFLLLCLVYYFQARTFLIDPHVLDLTPVQAILLSAGALVAGWFVYDRLCKSPLGKRTRLLALAVYLLAVIFAFFFSLVFSGRAAFLHVGAVLGTIMSANVFFVIIPNQKLVVADLIAGRIPDPALGEQCEAALSPQQLPDPAGRADDDQRPLSDAVRTALSLAVRRRDHRLRRAGAALLQSQGRRPQRQLDRLAAGLCRGHSGLARHRQHGLGQQEQKRRGRRRARATGRGGDDHPEPLRRLPFGDAVGREFQGPPKGIAFDTPEEIERNADQILRVAVETQAMPLANRTEMTPEERALVGRWALGGGH